MVAHLDRVFSVLPIAVTIRTVFLQEYPSWLNFLAVLGPCFFTSFHGGFTNKTVFLQQCPSWLLIGPCFYKMFSSGYYLDGGFEMILLRLLIGLCFYKKFMSGS